ncbi:ATP-binding cassette domain-containing protein [Paenibacillus sp. S150]|uniref:ATP-binding cassette domain-containing protein n=1 Tax=Paenibacillus sp. S150 TaxID=2749826 RepID=UPI001C57E8DE|nr:ATP-binding cassette domain-containing protein [Paenibacillus sp. S150]MBW4082124.1 ATP-binding cassette domain-containing protein [Paenibacillus sp. S150]
MRIQASRVSFRYDNLSVLTDINLDIREGTLTVLCGVTGSGKSTLLRLLSGLAQPAAGTIVFDGGNPAAREVSMVFQQPETQLFAGSVHKEIEYGLAQRGVPGPQRLELIRSALASVGLPYEEFGGRSPFLLSGGEKRRLCIAAAVASLPGVLILDEPTAGLDPQAAESLLDMLQGLRRNGLTLVIGTHDLDSFLPVADEVIVMSQGAVYYNGPASALSGDLLALTGAGLTPPAYLRLGYSLRQRGLLAGLPDSLDSLLAGLQTLTLPPPPENGPPPAGNVQCRDGCQGGTLPAEADTDSPGAVAGNTGPAVAGQLWQLLDPRVKWLGMVLGTLVVLGMDDLLPLLLAAGLIAGLILSARIPGRRTVRFFRPFLLMFLFLWLLSALSWNSPDYALGPVGISLEGMERGGLNVLRFLLLIALGFLFTETTTGAPLREALEWGIAPLRRLGVRTRNWSLAVSVTLQFVPWILGKLAQLQLALNSRGRKTRGLARWTPRQVALLIVPLLILVIGMGDELATAVESRGYDPSRERTPSYRLSWQKRDTLALLCILPAAALLWLVPQFS